jgi:hypothetical protein
MKLGEGLAQVLGKDEKPEMGKSPFSVDKRPLFHLTWTKVLKE